MSSLKSVERTLAILESFDERASKWTMQEIAARTQIPRSSIYRFLKLLVSQKFLMEIDDGDLKHYAIGPAILKLGRIGLGEEVLRRCAYPVMQTIADKTHESINLSVRRGAQAVCIENIEASTPLRYGSRVGRVLPLYAGSPKVLLAFLEPEMRDHLIGILDMKSLTSNTITNRLKLMARLNQIRRRGYEVSVGEIVPDTKAIGAPVLDSSGNACAVVSVSAPFSRISARDEIAIGRLIVRAAREITLRYCQPAPADRDDALSFSRIAKRSRG